MTEQRARGRQLDLLMLAARDLAPQRFEPARRSEIVTLHRIAAQRPPDCGGRDSGGGQ